MTAPCATPVAGGLRLRVRVQPRAARTRVVGLQGEALKVQVTAPPVEGAANDAVEELLAKLGGVPRAAVRIVAGCKSRDKIVEVVCADPPALLARLLPNPSVLRAGRVDKKMAGD